MKLTIKQLAEKLNVSQPEANGFVKVLASLGRANKVGNAPKAEGQRGRASVIYEIADSDLTPVSTETVAQETE